MGKTFQLTIPQRIVYAPYVGHGTANEVVYSVTGEQVVLAFFPEVYSPPLKVRCSYMKNKRVDGHHSAVAHCQVIAPPSVMHNNHACNRYVNGHGRDLRSAALLGRSRLVNDGESVCFSNPTHNFTTTRTWWTAFASRERYYAEEHEEIAQTITHDRWGITGHWPSYPCHDCRVRAIVQNEDGTIASIGGVYFHAHMNVHPSKQLAKERATINDFVRRIKAYHENGAIGTRISDKVENVGSFWAEWKSWDFTPSMKDHVYTLIPFHEDTSNIWPDLDLQNSFLYGEPVWFTDRSKLTIVHTDNGVASKVKTFQAEAFMNATEDIAIANDNLISTIVDCVSILKAVAQGEFSNIRRLSDFRRLLPQHLTDAFDLWLQYRYSYSTNKMDIGEFADFLKRTLGKNLLGTMSIKGSYSHDGVTCHCQAVLRSRNIKKLQKCLYILDRYGLCPDFYIVWDSIPYSFIIDWFVPIGDMVSRTDAQIRYSNLNYEMLYVSYSLAYVAPARLTHDQQLAYGDLNVKCYTRWQESKVPDLCWMYSDMHLSTNYWTWTKRGLDVVCMMAGQAI